MVSLRSTKGMKVSTVPIVSNGNNMQTTTSWLLLSPIQYSEISAMEAHGHQGQGRPNTNYTDTRTTNTGKIINTDARQEGLGKTCGCLPLGVKVKVV